MLNVYNNESRQKHQRLATTFMTINSKRLKNKNP